MNRRASLPGADELFRPTGGDSRVTPLRGAGSEQEPQEKADTAEDGGEETPVEASGRTSHDTKITVYMTQQELLDLEQARLRLQAEFGVKVDRGRIVREAIAELLNDLYHHGPDAAVVRNLS